MPKLSRKSKDKLTEPFVYPPSQKLKMLSENNEWEKDNGTSSSWVDVTDNDTRNLHNRINVSNNHEFGDRHVDKEEHSICQLKQAFQEELTENIEELISAALSQSIKNKYEDKFKSIETSIEVLQTQISRLLSLKDPKKQFTSATVDLASIPSGMKMAEECNFIKEEFQEMHKLLLSSMTSVHKDAMKKYQQDVNVTISSLTERLKNAIKDNTHLAESLELLKGKVEVMQNQESRITDQWKKNNGTSFHLENEYELEYKLEELSDLNSELKNQLGKKNRQVYELQSVLQKVCRDMKREIVTLRRDMKNAEDMSQTELNRRIHDLHRTLEESEKEKENIIVKYENQIEGKSKEINKLTTEMNKKISELQKTVNEIEKSKEKMALEFNTKVHTYKKVCKQLKSEYETEKSKVNALKIEQHIQRIQLSTSMSEQKDQELRSIVTNMESHYKKIIEEVQQNAKDVKEKLTKKVNDLESELYLLKNRDNSKSLQETVIKSNDIPRVFHK